MSTVSIMKKCKMASSVQFKMPTAEVDKNELRAENQTSLAGTCQGGRIC